jgi:hypothetical protein
MSDWTVICTRRLGPDANAPSHIGVNVPRGTQHVPIVEAIAAIDKGEHRFFVDQDGDRFLLRVDGDRLTTRHSVTPTALIEALPDCGDRAHFEAGANDALDEALEESFPASDPPAPFRRA